MLPKHLAFRDTGYIKFQIFLIAFLGMFVSKLTFYAFCLYHFSIICGLLKPPLLYFCNPSVVGVSFHLLVVLTLFGHFWQKESLLNLPIPLTLSGRGGGGLRCPDDQTHICHSETSYSMMTKSCDFQRLSLRHVLTKF